MDWVGWGADTDPAPRAASDGEAEQADDTGGGWFDALVATASAVAGTVVEAYREDLGDFVGAVATDTTQAVEEVQRSQWLAQARALATDNAVVRELTDALVAGTTDETAQPAVVPTSRLEAKIAELQRDIGTYCTEVPENQREAFVLFCATRQITSMQDEIAALLSASPLLQASHSKLVPVVVAYDDFWRRYLFREARLREREAERERLILKASEVSAGAHDEMPWDEDGEQDEQEGEWANADGGQVAAATPVAPATPTLVSISSSGILSALASPIPSDVATPVTAPSLDALAALDDWGDGDDGDADVVATPIVSTPIEDLAGWGEEVDDKEEDDVIGKDAKTSAAVRDWWQ